MPDYGMNMASVGNRNRAAILNYINKKGEASRKEIAGATGLTAAAVTQISQSLIKEGILTETGSLEGSGAGRKQVGLCIDYDCIYVLSVNIEQTRTVIALSNMKGETAQVVRLETKANRTPERLLGKIAEACRTMLDEATLAVRGKTAAICVGIPGIVDSERGIALHAYGIWEEEVAVCRILEGLTGLPTRLCNNVNAFALASSLYGIGRNYDNMLVIKWGPGVGGTILVDGKIYDGRHGKAAEIGHYIVRKNGKTCNCGRRGCLETVVSYAALQEQLSFKEGGLLKAYEKAEAVKQKNVEEALDLFARSIVNTVTVLAPDRVILSGFMFREEAVRSLLLVKIGEYDAALAAHRVLYTELSDCEDYIGPVAYYVNTVLQ